MASEREQQWIDMYIETGDAPGATREIFNVADKNVSARTGALKKYLGPEIDKALRKAMRHNSVACYSMLVKLATDAESEQVKVKALTDMLDRGGYKPVDQHEEVIQPKSKAEIEAQYAEALASVGKEDIAAILRSMPTKEREALLLQLPKDNH